MQARSDASCVALNAWKQADHNFCTQQARALLSRPLHPHLPCSCCRQGAMARNGGAGSPFLLTNSVYLHVIILLQ